MKTRKIGVFSAKGGVGKTTLSANLAAALASEFNREIMLIDGNISDANLALHFGITYPHINLNDVLKKRVDLKRAVYLDESGVKIIPASLSKTKVDLKKIKVLLKDLNGTKLFEILIVDTPPSLTGETLAIMQAVDDIIVITTPDIPSITGCIKTLDLAEEYGKNVLGIVLNRVKNKKYEVTKEEVESTCNIKVIATIPEDENIAKSIALQEPAVLSFPSSPAPAQFCKLASHLIGEERPSGFLSWFKKLFGIKRKKETDRRFEEIKLRMGE